MGHNPRTPVRLVAALFSLALASCGFEAVKPGDFIANGGGASCEALGKNCGSIQDGQGGVLQCGTCAAGETCGADGVDNVCCTPTTCAEQGATCGEMSDGCGGVVSCGACAPGLNCGGDGIANACGSGQCTPTACASLGFDCGSISDGCGGLAQCGVCSGNETCGGAGAPNVCGSGGVAIPAELVEGCFDWPSVPFSQSNFASNQIFLRTGALAVDFRLADLSGNEVQLSQLLAEKPVMIQSGSYTCPVYQGKIPASDQLSDQFGQHVHFLVLYTVEAHPRAPDPSPYRGRVWEQTYSDFGNPETYAGRAQNASQLGIGANQKLLLDDLGTTNNPFWCTYGTAPNAGWLIRQDGVIELAQPWIDVSSMGDAIQGLLVREGIL